MVDLLRKIGNRYRFIRVGRGRGIELKADIAAGVDDRNDPTQIPGVGEMKMVVPWDVPPRRVYVYRDGRFVVR